MAAKKPAKKPVPNNPYFHPEDYPFPHCREQHVWRPHDAVHDTKLKKGFRIRVCENCDMKIHTIMELDPTSDDYGRVIDRRYIQPKGYRIKGGIDWHDRALLIAQIFFTELRREQS